MRYLLPVTVAVFLTAFSVRSASAQLPALTDADVTRLAAMHVSDQTVMAVIHEATARQFDLSPQAVNDLVVSGVSTAVIATMRQSSTRSADGLPLIEPLSAAGAETLVGSSAEAAAQAAAASGQRPQLSIVGPSIPSVLPAPRSTSEGRKSDGTSATKTIVVDGEAYWKDQMRGLQTALDYDVTLANDLLTRLGLHDEMLSNSADVIDREPPATNDELSRARATVKKDKRVINDLEEEARRAGIPPGWLRNP